jgi:hypothetical protein
MYQESWFTFHFPAALLAGNFYPKAKPTLALASGLVWERTQNLLCSPELARADGTAAATAAAATTTVLVGREHSLQV